MVSRYLRDLNNAVGGQLTAPTVAQPRLLNPGLDPALAGGAAVGVANSSVDAQLEELASAVGVANATASAILLEAAAGSGVAIASSNTQLLEAALAVGIANAWAGTLLFAGGSATGEADAFAIPGPPPPPLSSERIAFLQDWTSRHLRYAP